MGYERKEQLARNITMALTTGIFSIIPVVVEGAPVVDKVVTEGTSVAQNGTVTDVTSTVQNNIVKWKDFSVAKGETVRFDKGAQTNNYLNIVTGAKQSEIAGAVEGGKNVYIVNPHGVLIDKGATVNVGNLYVSTTTPNKLDTKSYLATGASPLVNTANVAAADVTNLGNIQATNVTIEGNNIEFMNTADVSADNVMLDANGTITLGHAMETTTASNPGVLRLASASTASVKKPNYVMNKAPQNITKIETQAELQGIGTSGSYKLYNDIELSDSFTPIGEDTAFTGTFDGGYHTISNLNVSGVQYGGLFGQTGTTDASATIKNVGVSGGTVSAGWMNDETGIGYGEAGAIAGYAVNTNFENVFNKGVQVALGNDYSAAGGIVGKAVSCTINKAYNTGSASGGGGIVGYSQASKIFNAYNTNSEQKFGIVAESVNKDSSKIRNVYTTSGVIYSDYYKSTDTSNAYVNASTDSAADYKSLSKVTWDKAFTKIIDKDGTMSQESDLGNSGSGDTTWRIYEGYSMPLLRDMLRRGSSSGLTVNYHYEMGKQSGDVSGENLTGDKALTYNNNDLVLSKVSFTNDDFTSENRTVDEEKIKNAGTFHNANSYDFTDGNGGKHTSTAKDLIY